MENQVSVSNLILIGSTSRNSGKTTLAASIIEKLKMEHHVVALKITCSDGKNEKCIHGNHSCGVCSDFPGDYVLTEEESGIGNKDTNKLLAAGAAQVFWLKTLKSEVHQGFKEFLARMPENAMIICESNTLRKHVIPDLFIMVTRADEKSLKPSASAVMDYADIVVRHDNFERFDQIINGINEKINEKRLRAQAQS